MTTLTAWPEQIQIECELTSGWIVATYERARAEAAIQRLRLLHSKAQAVVIEYRREFEKGELADVDELEEALQAIGEIPGEGV